MKILIISYYAFPLNAVPSYRIESFCEGFTKEGADVTLLTRHWDESFKSWEDILVSNKKKPEIKNENGYRKVFLPYKAKSKDSRFRLISTLTTFRNYLIGNLQPETDTYHNFRDYALSLLQKEKDFDLILVSAPPNNLIKLGYFLNKKTQVPFIVDFRDFLNDEYLTINKELNLRTKLLNKFTKLYIKKWLKKAKLVTTVSPFLKNIFEKEFQSNTELTLNGYERQQFLMGERTFKPNKKFTLRYIGTAYKGIDFRLIIDGLLQLKTQHPNRKLYVEFIGVNNDEEIQKFKSILSKDEIKIDNQRVSKSKVIEKCINTDILLISWNMFKDNYGTKVFDYLASGSHILLCPPDNSIVEDLIRNHENGSVANTAEEVVQILEEQYALWEKGENKSKINNYPQFARENIAVEFYQKLKALVE